MGTRWASNASSSELVRWARPGWEWAKGAWTGDAMAGVRAAAVEAEGEMAALRVAAKETEGVVRVAAKEAEGAVRLAVAVAATMAA